jgi:hypothetical protein
MQQIRLLAALVVVSASVLVTNAAAEGQSLKANVASAVTFSPPPSICPDASGPLFGPNVCVFNDTMSQTAIQADIDAIATQQVPLSAQLDSDRYSIFFEPGTYGSTTPLVFQVGYYTQVAGLGAVPQDTVINGLIEVTANAPDSTWYNSDDNFWRSLSNLTLNVKTGSSSPTGLTSPPLVDPYTAGCVNSEETWSTSQATPIRSVIINGNINFDDYCSGANDYASGGFVANSEVIGQLNWSGNQQEIARNTDMESAVGYVWNYVYSGDACPPGYTPPPPATACSPTEDAFNDTDDIGGGTDGIYGENQITELPKSPVTEEEPFLYTDSHGNSDVFVPALEHNSVGPNFLSGTEAGSSIPLSRFFIASPSTPEFKIQAALDFGQDLVLTPGVYDLDASIVVNHPDTIVLGLGFATLIPEDGNASMVVIPNSGVKLSGMIFDAGPHNSSVLLSVGTPGGYNSANDPDLIQDVFFRIGGAETTPVSATVSLIDNADNSIIDDVWAWRADHGANTSVTGPDGQVGAGWTFNRGDTGLIVTGDNVTAYGLAVEHYQKDEVIWSGNNGTDIFFQNELPYDPPSQAAWETSPSQPGFPSFLVTNNVQSFHGYGMGSYVVFIYTNATLYDAMAYQAPKTHGVVFTDVMDLFISSTCSVNDDCTTPPGSGGDLSVIDGVGGSATSANPTTPVDVDSYSDGVATLP